jgi:hypothetical protein
VDCEIETRCTAHGARVVSPPLPPHPFDKLRTGSLVEGEENVGGRERGGGVFRGKNGTD